MDTAQPRADSARRRTARSLLEVGRRSRWLTLFVIGRLSATAVAATLLLVHPITDHDGVLTIVVLTYGIASALAAIGVSVGRWLPLVWVIDVTATLGLVVAGEDWRSPFYLLALTALVLPTTALPFRRAIGFTVAFTVGYLGVAATTGIDWDTLNSTTRLESFATHLLLPLFLGVGLAYSERLLQRLGIERERSERLALEAERRRLARELHDSAKQRVHAAHLVLSSIQRAAEPGARDGIAQALGELEAASSEMDASLSGLRRPQAEGTLLDALRLRASQLEAIAGTPVTVSGDDPALSAQVQNEVFNVVSEAVSNAIRHAGAHAVQVSLAVENGRLAATVIDDGRGLPDDLPPESHGIRSMLERAEIVGGHLTIRPLGGAPGTRVRLEVPMRGEAT